MLKNQLPNPPEAIKASSMESPVFKLLFLVFLGTSKFNSMLNYSVSAAFLCVTASIADVAVRCYIPG